MIFFKFNSFVIYWFTFLLIVYGRLNAKRKLDSLVDLENEMELLNWIHSRWKDYYFIGISFL